VPIATCDLHALQTCHSVAASRDVVRRGRHLSAGLAVLVEVADQTLGCRYCVGAELQFDAQYLLAKIPRLWPVRKE